MADPKLQIVVMNGPLKGKKTPLKEGIIFGRGPGTLVLDDAKVSGRHAQVFKNAAGQMILKDLGSTNGIVTKGKKVRGLVLSVGVEFQIGRTLLAVELDAAAEPKPEPKTETPPPPPPKLEWPEYFSAFVQRSRTRVKNRPKELLPFPKIIKLTVLRGLQADWEWFMGYGPRSVGRGSVDYPIIDPAAPEKCFTIRADGESVLIETKHLGDVLLNQKRFSSEALKNGDLIAFGANVIEVSFVSGAP
jgi:hypothetical protein